MHRCSSGSHMLSVSSHPEHVNHTSSHVLTFVKLVRTNICRELLNTLWQPPFFPLSSSHALLIYIHLLIHVYLRDLALEYGCIIHSAHFTRCCPSPSIHQLLLCLRVFVSNTVCFPVCLSPLLTLPPPPTLTDLI